MIDLRSKYDYLLEIMRKNYANNDGSELTFYSEGFVGRITALMCLFIQFSHMIADKK